MFNSGSQTVIVHPTNPDHNAKVTVTTSNGSFLSKLPATISSSPSSFTDVTVSVSDECYNDMTITVGKSVAVSYWVNILNIYGFFIDPLTGTMWNLDSQVTMPVQKKETTECLSK